MPVAAGEAQVEVAPQPSTPGGATVPLFTTSVTIRPGEGVTLLAVSQHVTDNAQPRVIPDQPPSAAAGGARVRVINAAGGAPPLPVAVSGPITAQFGDVRYQEVGAYVG
jgi:hypothetical protein